MKKFSIVNKLLILLLLFVPIIVSAKEEVKVYLFWGVGCPHCENAKKFFKEFEKDYSDKYELIEIEVYQNQNNSKLMNDASIELDKNVEGVPFIVIGEETFGGFSSAIEPDIKEVILKQYEEGSIDVVGKVIEEKGYEIGDSEPNSGSIIIMFLILVLIGGTFFIFGKKK